MMSQFVISAYRQCSIHPSIHFLSQRGRSPFQSWWGEYRVTTWTSCRFITELTLATFRRELLQTETKQRRATTSAGVMQARPLVSGVVTQHRSRRNRKRQRGPEHKTLFDRAVIIKQTRRQWQRLGLNQAHRTICAATNLHFEWESLIDLSKS